MIRNPVIWVLGLFFVAVNYTTAFADQSIGYQYYFNEGVKAFKEHDDPKALRCFKIAQIYDPNDAQLNTYIDTLDQRRAVLDQNPPQTIGPLPPSAAPQAIAQPQSYSPSAQPQPSAIIPKSIVYVT